MPNKVICGQGLSGFPDFLACPVERGVALKHGEAAAENEKGRTVFRFRPFFFAAERQCGRFRLNLIQTQQQFFNLCLRQPPPIVPRFTQSKSAVKLFTASVAWRVERRTQPLIFLPSKAAWNRANNA
ncbi:MAG: hypothetical protein ACTFAK_14560 [Candidatus Electronema sp. VV]